MPIAVNTARRRESVLPTKFERIARRYDFANTVLSLGLHRGWKRALIQTLSIQPGDLVVDAGTGTGDLAHLAAAQGARVVGVDLSPAMLSVAAQRGGVLQLVRGDLCCLPLADRSAAAIGCAFVLRHLPDLREAFGEFRRVLAPGGRLAVLEFGRPASWLRPVYETLSARLIPLIGGWLTGDRGAYEFLVRSIRSFPEPDQVAAVLRSTGFRNVRWRPLAAGIAILHTASTAP